MKRSLLIPWTCSKCLSQRQTARLTAALLPGASRRSRFHAATGATALDQDDRLLRQVFDSHAVWQDFSRASRAGNGQKNAGLLQNVYLNSPEGFRRFADTSLEKCRKVVSKILGVSTLEGYRNIVKDLDRLSDLLCRIIDLSDFVRSTHPDPLFQHEAAQAHALMYEYMNTLNTTTGLNDQLRHALEDAEVTKAWSEEEMKVAQILRKDFAQSAIDLPVAKRQRFIELSNTVQELGLRFVDEMRPAKRFISLDATRLKGASPLMLRELTDRRGKIELPTIGSAAAHVLRYAEDPEVRKLVYIASRTAAEAQVKVLDQLLHARAQIAELSGFKSFASMSLTDKMAKTPEAVAKFLEALAMDNAIIVKEELKRMQSLKRLSHPSEDIKAWDRDFYRAKLSRASERATRLPDQLPAFFSLGTVMQGLSRLFSHLYGVRFEPAEPQPGESWTPEVRRLNVIDEREGLIAVIYCDLFARPGKSPNPAHFTLRGSRRISAEEVAEVDETLGHLSPDASVGFLANDGMAISHNSDGSLNQLPVIALICDFPPPASAYTPPLLPISHLTTLFHEMGHAIHSVLGRTELQNVAGTRCATDFAELPSVLMERFATHPDVLALYARHWETDAPLPREKAAELHYASQHKSAAARAADAADTEAQVRLALLDQAFHGRRAVESPAWNTDAIMHKIDAAYGAVPEPLETRWQGFFGHLVGYGGSYYAYLFDRAIAGKVWDVVFAGGHSPQGGPVRREAGERFREQVLRWGGSRDGWACVSSVLGEEGAGLEDGGEAAMAKVGRWGIGTA